MDEEQNFDGASGCVGAGAPSRTVPGGARRESLAHPKAEGWPIGGYLGTGGVGIVGVSGAWVPPGRGFGKWLLYLMAVDPLPAALEDRYWCCDRGSRVPRRNERRPSGAIPSSMLRKKSDTSLESRKNGG